MPDNESVVDEIARKLCELVEPSGFEVYPFLTGWYNEHVDEIFRLRYPTDQVAFLLISTPSMFEKTFIPFIIDHELEELGDPIDQSMLHFFRTIVQEFPTDDIDVIHDFELHPNKRPKLLAQTAAHVAGAAYLYRVINISTVEKPSRKMLGLNLHSKYGGWFAIRGCLIFRNLLWSDLPRKEPEDILIQPADQIKALELFNYHWRDSRYRDVVPVKEKYSDDQQLYFNTPPGQRRPVLEIIRQKHLKSM